MKKVDFIVDYKKYSITSDDVLRVARSAQPEQSANFTPRLLVKGFHLHN